MKTLANEAFELRFNLYIRGLSNQQGKRRQPEANNQKHFQAATTKTRETGSKVRSILESRILLLRMEIFVGFYMRPR